MPRETYCSKCQGMVNGNGCDQQNCEVNDGKGFREKMKTEARKSQTAPTAPVVPSA